MTTRSIIAFLLLTVCTAHAADDDIAKLVDQLSKKVDAKATADAGYSAAMHKQLAAWLPHLDKNDEEDKELFANAKSLAAGELTGEVFAIYFREAHLRPPKRRAKYLAASAKSGSPEAMYETAMVHLTGSGGAKLDLKAGNELLKKAAEAGSIDAMNAMGDLLRLGLGGLARDEKEAAAWYRKSADAGSATGMLMLSDMLFIGRGIEADVKESTRWLDECRKLAQKSADAGEAEGNFILGYLLIDDANRGLTKDPAKAIVHYRKAAEKGHASAMNAMGYLYGHGIGGEKDLAAALEWWTKAAEKEQIDAIQWIARVYRDGMGVTRDYEKTMEWYTKAAERGSGFAMNEVGYLHDAGLGVQVNYDEAMAWYRKASEVNHPKGTRNVGALHAYAKGRERNNYEAFTWWKKAAALGDVQAMYDLGILLTATTTEADLRHEEQGTEWMKRAAKAGDERAKEWLKDKGVKGE